MVFYTGSVKSEQLVPKNQILSIKVPLYFNLLTCRVNRKEGLLTDLEGYGMIMFVDLTPDSHTESRSSGPEILGYYKEEGLITVQCHAKFECNLCTLAQELMSIACPC